MKEIFEIRSCMGILANDIEVNTAEQHIQSTFTVQQAQCKLAGNVMTAKNTLQAKYCNNSATEKCSIENNSKH